MAGRRPRAPQSMDAAGRSLWRSVLADYELSAAEAEVLRQACRTADLVARLDALLIGADLIVDGHAGQPRAHPLISASADQRRVLDSLLRSLCLPMPDEVTGHRRSPRAAEAAQARWRAQRGRYG